MEKFNLKSAIEHYSPDIDELSKVLFPYIKYPKQAFDRVLRGEANLDTNQVCQLASYLGVMVSDLFTLDEGWHGSYDKCLTFAKGLYRVNLNYDGAFVSVYKDGKLIHQEVRNTVQSMTITDFIQYINKLIS